MKTKTNILFYFFLLTFAFILCPLSFILVSCNTTEPPPPVNGNGNDKPKPKLTLTVDDTSPTEVWLNLITENISLPDTLKLIRNNDTVKTIELFDSSFVIYDDSLLPSQSYSYQVSSIEYQVSSEPVTAVTMDTTSHNFTWEVFEFGEHGNSVLRDVAIIDENNIWAVGAIYLKDSTGANDSKLYNAVHWDGSQWNVQRITTDFHGNPITLSLEGIYGFSAHDIWMVGSLPIHGDGENWEVIDVREITNSDLSLSKAWGTNSNNMYFVGRGGSIAHYNGTSWRKIESGTDVRLVDIWGDEEGNVWVTGWEDFKPTQLLHIKDRKVNVLYSESSPIEYPHPSKFSGRLKSIWTKKFNKQFILTTYGIYQMRYGGVETIKLNYGFEPSYYGDTQKLRGDNVNNIFIGGNNREVWHYNGCSWKLFTEIVEMDNYTLSIAVNESTAVIVGEKFNNQFYYKAFITVLKN